ncbi:hypothetical protein BDW02DRAFT_506587 [Decorospora gaudefroyi]|uniref:DUF1365-domain-containing protein n=1 Tax=Decorospora gaudefroyi TaxID=184978 RepID=A0A6A5K1I8_9PLEO|nr:hypothetical protein BDW02DRAFT_506587 [Decorospora gaudefroyi]
MFPKRHAFAYSYLQCGYPIIPNGTTHNGAEFPSGEDRHLGSWWLRARAEDYLERGNGARGFYWKLKTYLKAQHVEDSEWSYAYLVTAPRFFGYSFNPVSFWYIYDREHQFKRMILEVNNTFGERRMYLLDGSSPASPPPTPESQGSSLSEEQEPEFPNGAKSKFTDIWMKDFHVSPFNSRKGSYALKAMNPFPSPLNGNPTIDNAITLKTSKDHAKLVARLHSTGKALSPDQMGLLGTLRFVLSWWWVGLVTFPRIVRQAFALYTKRKLHVWFRPEVVTPSIGRLPTPAETTLQKVFKHYLLKLVNETADPFRITFKSSIPDVPTDIITTTQVPGRERPTKNLEIRVLTPAFYSRLIHYAYTSEAIDRECIFTDERNRTLWMCRPQLLPLLLSEPSSVRTKEEDIPAGRRSYLDELRWMLLRILRCSPADPAYAITPQSSSFNIDDIRARPYSELDNFVRSSLAQVYAGEYRRIVTKLFLAQRFCFGFSEIVGLVDLILRVFLCYLAAMRLKSWSDTNVTAALAECSERLVAQKHWAACSAALGNDGWDLWWLAKSAMSVYACHAYGLLKGYR